MSDDSDFGTASYPRGVRRGSRGFARATRGRHPLWAAQWRGRGKVAQSDDPPPQRLIGDLVATVDISDLSPIHIPLKIRDCNFVASYNWLDGEMPTILVPGSPPLWSPPAATPRLRQDDGEYFRDLNAARYPDYPTEPGVRALLSMQPDFDATSIDIVACDYTLRSLLKVAGSLEQSVSFDVDVIGNTVFFVRKGTSPKELIPGVVGYGHTFPESYTRWGSDTRRSVSHQRIVKYSFGGLTCLVRFGSDGYLSHLTENPLAEKQRTPKPASLRALQDSDDEMDAFPLSAATDSLSLTQKAPAPSENLKLEFRGTQVPQKAVFELKTRSANREIDMDEILPRIWVSQTPNFIIGYHNSGVFDDIRVQDVRDKVQDWEGENQNLLGRYYAIIRRIIDTAKGLSGNKIEVFRVGDGPLQIRKQLDAEWNALPADLRKVWGTPQNQKLELEDSSSPPSEIIQPAAVGNERNIASRPTSKASSSFGPDAGYGDLNDDSPTDFTACTSDTCGYCGHCEY
ncbi:MAG: hypothetical protein M1837_006312 [Sclerophora amabilis]|nr:MAG: hypothetical protein M1837_006312 [Sclerophora amabilis]